MTFPRRPGEIHYVPDDDFYNDADRIVEDDLQPGELPAGGEQPPDVIAASQLPIGKELYEYLCGTAGTGKTYMAKQLRETDPSGIELAATTGIAAVNLGEGTTIHALLKFFDTQSLREAYRGGMLQAQLRRLRSAGLKRIIIDEVSMMSGEMLTLITKAVVEINEKVGQADEDDVAAFADDGGVDESAEDAGRKVRKRPKNDWPIGITLVGDFGQLPPVPDKDPLTQKNIPITYAFEAPEWKRYAPHIVKLEKIWRQGEDELQFVRALHAVRRGDVASALAFFTPDRFSDTTDENFDGTTIYAKNLEVDRHNGLKLDALPGKPMSFAAIRTGKQRGDWKQIPDVLQLKEGALVMLLANRREYSGKEDSKGRIVYANGDLGILIGPSGELNGWKVKLHRNGETVLVVPALRENTVPLEPGRKKEIKEEIHREAVRQLFGEDPWVVQRDAEGEALTEGQEPSQVMKEVPWHQVTPEDLRAAATNTPTDDPVMDEIDYDAYASYLQFTQNRLAARITEDGKKEIVGTVQYMPMRAAYGCTVHKTQGLTLDKVQINIRDPFFAHPGMLFVALSRCRTAEGLRIIGNQSGFLERCKVEPRVQPWL
jgi:hypothetical protein